MSHVFDKASITINRSSISISNSDFFRKLNFQIENSSFTKSIPKTQVFRSKTCFFDQAPGNHVFLLPKLF